jgi:hypothetical protein
MDREVIEHKLESLRRCLQRIAEKCPSNPDKLGQDPDLQDIVTLNLSRAVQLCVDLAHTSLSTWMCRHRYHGPNVRCLGSRRCHL